MNKTTLSIAVVFFISLFVSHSMNWTQAANSDPILKRLQDLEDENEKLKKLIKVDPKSKRVDIKGSLNILNSSGGSATQLNVLNYKFKGRSDSYIHIKCPETENSGHMFRYSLKGYAYQNPSQKKILELVWVGYTHQGELINEQSIDLTGKGINLKSYIGPGRHIYLRFGPIQTHFVSFTLDRHSGAAQSGFSAKPEDFNVKRSNKEKLETVPE